MKVKAEVAIMGQQHYPMEHRLAGVALCEDCHAEADEPRYEKDTAPSDIVLIEGAWLRYGKQRGLGRSPDSPALTTARGVSARPSPFQTPREATAPISGPSGPH